jgi:hypothetical protein
MLRVRARYRINESEQVALPPVRAPGLVVMVHRLPDGAGTQVTAVNFARTPVREAVAIEPAPAGAGVTDLFGEKPHGRLAGKRLSLTLGPHEGQVLLIK